MAMELTKELVLQAINQEFPDAVLHSSEPFDLLTLEIKREEIKKVIHHLKDSSLGFTFLTDVCGVHYPSDKGRELAVVYHLHNLVSNIRLRLKTYIPSESPVVETITDLFPGANWMERETYDFFGIRFNGHPDLRTILNANDLGYHPMLKQYRLEDETRTDKDDKMFGR